MRICRGASLPCGPKWTDRWPLPVGLSGGQIEAEAQAAESRCRFGLNRPARAATAARSPPSAATRCERKGTKSVFVVNAIIGSVLDRSALCRDLLDLTARASALEVNVLEPMARFAEFRVTESSPRARDGAVAEHSQLALTHNPRRSVARKPIPISHGSIRSRSSRSSKCHTGPSGGPDGPDIGRGPATLRRRSRNADAASGQRTSRTNPSSVVRGVRGSARGARWPVPT